MSNDEQEIRDLVTKWTEATKRGEIQAVLSLMTEDVVFLMPGRPPMVGRSSFETAANAQSSAAENRPEFEGTSDIQEVQVLGDWAFMWTKLRVKVTPPGGSPVTRAGHTLSVLKKENGKWLLARDANMLSVVEEDSW
jgi:uncharacterized protein (TIGR02246 family)